MHFMKVNGVKHIRVAPYHAANNVSGERMVHSFNNDMKACKGSKLSIQQRTANYVLTYRSIRHPTTGRTPDGLFLGQELHIHLTVLRPSVWEKLMYLQVKQKATHEA